MTFLSQCVTHSSIVFPICLLLQFFCIIKFSLFDEQAKIDFVYFLAPLITSQVEIFDLNCNHLIEFCDGATSRLAACQFMMGLLLDVKWFIYHPLIAVQNIWMGIIGSVHSISAITSALLRHDNEAKCFLKFILVVTSFLCNT